MGKVTLISLHFPPSAASGAFRMLGFARHLPASGWSTSVIACPDVPNEPVDPATQSEVPASTRVRYIEYPKARLAEIGGRLLTLTGVVDPHAIWCYTARKACDEWIARERPDVVLTSGPPHSVHLLGRWLKRRHPVRLVTDYRDPWAASSTAATGVSMVVRRALERAAMRASDGIIANAPRALEAFTRAYPDSSHKMTMIPNGYDPASPAVEAFRPSSDEPVTILHTGELYLGRDPLALLDAMSLAEQSMSDPTPWLLQFVGRTEGSGLNLLAEAARRRLRSTVAVEAQVPYHSAKARMRRAGILLLMDGPGRRVGVPAKVYEYIGANRPILALAEPDGDTAWALEASGAVYRLARPDDPVAIRQALVEISTLARASTSDTPPAADSPFTRGKLAGELAAFLDAVLAGRASPAVSRGVA
jgi:glycosyltransferase involved in cell wall biosynthesis